MRNEEKPIGVYPGKGKLADRRRKVLEQFAKQKTRSRSFIIWEQLEAGNTPLAIALREVKHECEH